MCMFLVKATTDTSLYRSLRRTSPPLCRLFYLLVETTFNEVSEWQDVKEVISIWAETTELCVRVQSSDKALGEMLVWVTITEIERE